MEQKYISYKTKIIIIKNIQLFFNHNLSPSEFDINRFFLNLKNIFKLPENIKDIMTPYWDKKKLEKLKLTDNNILKEIQSIYEFNFNNLIEKYSLPYIDFVNKKEIISDTFTYHYLKYKQNPIKTFLNIHKNLILIIDDKLEELWKRQYLYLDFDKVAKIFNKAANHINLGLHLINKIPFAIPPKENKIVSTKYKQNINIESLTSTPIDKEECENLKWKLTVYNMIEQNIPIENLKNINPFYYNELRKFHNLENITIHSSKYAKCSVPKEQLQYVLEYFLNEIEQLKTIPITDNSKRYYLFGNKKNKKIETYTLGDLYVSCPCIIGKMGSGTKCYIKFCMNSEITIKSFYKTFSIDFASIKLIKIILNKIKEARIKIDTSFRVNSKCPNCNYINYSEEAYYNRSGCNPIKKHPSDVLCENCHFQYCTDCKLSHPNIICRGFSSDEDPGPTFQKAPCCRASIERIEGCTYIKCICKKSWCWKCRCIRDVEYALTNIHYCIIDGQYTSNPNWSNIIPYKTLAPTITDEFTPP
jgi:hypothetical protein